MPPPPPPPPPPSSVFSSKTQNRSMLLNEIQQGKRLKKTATDDRSAPIITGNTNNPKSTDSNNPPAASNVTGKMSSGIGALFANGIPRKPSEAKNLVRREMNTESSVITKPSSTRPAVMQLKSNISSASTDLSKGSNSAIQPPPPPTKAKPSLPAVPPVVSRTLVTQSTTKKSSIPPTPTTKLHNVEFGAPLYKSNDDSAASVMKKQSENFTMGKLSTAEFFMKSNLSHSSDQHPIRTENSEEIPNKSRRPAAPPPPPPGKNRLASSVGEMTHYLQPKLRSDAELNPTNGKNMSSVPPQPPPRVSSYLDSIEQRFHFLPLSELPPPPPFLGFQKVYGSAT